MNLKEAVSQYVKDGCSLSIGAVVSREPFAACCEIVRQGKKNLTLITDSSSDSAELLIASGCISKAEMAYIWIGAIGLGYNFRRAVEKGIPNYIDVQEYSNLAMGLRFMAAASGVPYMPTCSLLGSDLVKANPNIKILDNPYGEGKVAAVPAAQPDVAFIHVQRADQAGNAQIWGATVNDDLLARAAKQVVLTCEEIIPTSEIRKIPNMTAIPSYCVSAVVEVPFGSYPCSVSGYYWIDQPFRQEMVGASKTREGILEWMNKWVYGVHDHAEYLEKVGHERLQMLAELEHDNYKIPL